MCLWCVSILNTNKLIKAVSSFFVEEQRKMKTILLLFTLSSNFYGVSAILVLTLLFLLNRKRFLFASSSSTPSLISSGSTNSNLRSLFTFHSPLALCQFNFILFACFTFPIQLALMLKLGLFRAYNSTSQIFTLSAFVALQLQQNLEILFFWCSAAL